jgi:hypothetical protein
LITEHLMVPEWGVRQRGPSHNDRMGLRNTGSPLSMARRAKHALTKCLLQPKISRKQSACPPKRLRLPTTDMGEQALIQAEETRRQPLTQFPEFCPMLRANPSTAESTLGSCHCKARRATAVTAIFALVFAFSATLLVLVSSAESGERMSPRRVESIRAEVSPTTTSIIPGSRYRLDVILNDDDGNEYRLSDGTIRTDLLLISWINLQPSADETSFSLIEGNLDELEGKRALIAIQYGRRDSVVFSDVEFLIDVAALRGPRPETVTTIEFDLEGTISGRLAPGRVYRIADVSVRDINGRQFALRQGEHGLPRDRIEWSSEGLSVDTATMLVETSVDEIHRHTEYSLTAAYKGSGITRTKRFDSDFDAALGPNPSTVVRLEIRGQPETVGPGQWVDVEIRATNLDGREFSTSDPVVNLPWERLSIKVENAELAGDRIRTSTDCSMYLYDKVSVAASYVGNASVTARNTINISMIEALRPYFVQTSDLAFEGPSGTSGPSGGAGRQGRDGRDASDVYGSGGIGSPGQPGERGGDGRHGEPGPSVEVRVAKAAIADRSQWVLVGQVLVDGEVQRFGPNEFFLRPIDSGPLRVSSVGGDGGNGGSGGKGGQGGRGGKGWSTGSGGVGGPGGSGGNGGNGGRGGNVIARLGSADISSMITLDSRGGRGGRGGDPGRGGGGGRIGAVAAVSVVGGLLDAATKGYAGDTTPPPPSHTGSRGQDGHQGGLGMAGTSGSPGMTDIMVQGGIAETIRASLPEEVVQCLWFED